MHLEAGFAVSRPAIRPETITPVRLEVDGGTRELLTACRYFALERLELAAGGSAMSGRHGSPSVVTVLEGSVEIAGQQVGPGQSAVVWAGQEDVHLEAAGDAKALVCWVPELEAEVVEPALAAGSNPVDVAALSGATGDISTSRPAT